MNDNLPPLPPYAPEFKPRWATDPGGYNEEQMQAYARAAIEKDRERQSLPTMPVAEITNIGDFGGFVKWLVHDGDLLKTGDRLFAAAPQPEPVHEPVMYQFRWTNPAGQQANDTAIEWTQVEPRWNGTVQEKCAELLSHRYGEKPCYEVRALYTFPQIKGEKQ